MTYKIQCQVTGGITGTRTSTLRENGAEWSTTDWEEAENKAKSLNEKMNGPNARAHFMYWVI